MPRLELSRRALLVASGTLVAAIVLGIAAASGGKLSYVAVGIAGAAALATFVAFNVRRTLLLWASLSGLAYPFIRYPLHASPYADFDRIVIGAMLVAT